MLNTGKLAGKTLYISGASRGIGKAIALKAARDGAKIVVAAKTAEPNPSLPGTIYTAAEESKLNPASAFTSGKLKMAGNLGKAMALENVMKKMNSRGYHTMIAPARIQSSIASRGHGHNNALHNLLAVLRYSTEGPQFSTVSEVFERIKNIASAEMVSKVNATYVFDVDGEGTYFIDFSAGDGNVGQGEVPDKPGDYKPDVRITISKDNCLKMFNMELQPATAFMTGKLKLSGDLSKALALETVMKNARGQSAGRGFHTSATQLTGIYASVADVRDRMKLVASEKIVSEVKAIYLFDVEDEGKFFVDFKNDSGLVGEGEPPVDKKPDVTIKMNSEVFIKIFNREIAPATAFMSGKVKISGDLTKALTLEKVMKAAREAEATKK